MWLAYNYRGPRNCPVEGFACGVVSIRGAIDVLDREPIFSGDTSIRKGCVIICVDVKVSPAAARSGCVFTDLLWV